MQAFFASFANAENACFRVKRLRMAFGTSSPGRHPFRLLTAFAATFPKGTAFGNAGKSPATTKAVPLGKVAKPQALTEGVSRAAKKPPHKKVQRLCGVSPHSQRSAMIHHIPGRLIRPSRCSNTISMVFSFQTVRFSRTAPLAKTEAALSSCRRPKG